MTTRVNLAQVTALVCGFGLACSASSVAVGQTAPAAPLSVSASPEATTFTVRGKVTSGKTPLPGVTVTASNTLTGKKVATATAPDGSFTLTLPARRSEEHTSELQSRFDLV